jgi:hypothetical protein
LSILAAAVRLQAGQEQNMKRLLVIISIFASFPSLAQHKKLTEHTVKLEEGASPAKASVAEMAWLAGRWTGDGLGGRTEEMWAPPDAGTMIGTFRLIQKDKPVFYEFMTLLETERGLAMRLKHFHPDVTAWEEREKFVEFLYVGSADGFFHFEGLSFQREGADTLTIYLALKSKGELREEKFRMFRQK